MQRVRLFVAWLLIALALLAVLIANRWWVPDVGLVVYVDTFVAIFLGIMYEAVPFLTAGSLVAAAIHLFVQPEWLTRILPKHRLLQNLTASLLGVLFPVCECGSIPTARSLIQRGASPTFGMVFAMAAPVINPIVLISTSVAFVGVWGWDFVLWRFGLTIFVAMIVAQFIPTPHIMTTTQHHHHPIVTDDQLPLLTWLRQGAWEWLDMMRYLVAGALIAALIQVVVPVEVLLQGASNPWLAAPIMMGLAAVMSICSTVDSFVGLSFANVVSPAAVMAFLVFGPIIDLKSIPMFAGLFGWWTAVRMVALVALCTLTLCMGLEWLGWL